MRVCVLQVDCISSQDLSHIEESFIGTVLPSLVTGLLPFAYQPALALKLMPLVSELYSVLSRIAAALPDVVALDHSYARQRSGDLPPDGQSGAGIVTPPLSVARPKRSGAAHSSSTAADGRRGIDALQLPRFYCLLKSLAFLAGRLAGTLTAGEGQYRKCMASLRADPTLNRWACAPLLSGGLDPTCGELLGRPVVVLTPTHRPRAPAQNCRASHHSEGSVRLGSGLPSSARLADLFDGLCAGTEGQALLQRVRDQVKAGDATYAMLWRQAERAADVALVQEMERSVWAAVLRHSGLSMELFLLTKSTPRTQLPQRWVKAYTHVAEVSLQWRFHDILNPIPSYSDPYVWVCRAGVPLVLPASQRAQVSRYTGGSGPGHRAPWLGGSSRVCAIAGDPAGQHGPLPAACAWCQ